MVGQAAQTGTYLFVNLTADENKVSIITLDCTHLFLSQSRVKKFHVCLPEGAIFDETSISNEIGTGAIYINDSDRTGLEVPPSDPLALCKVMANSRNY